MTRTRKLLSLFFTVLCLASFAVAMFVVNRQGGPSTIFWHSAGITMVAALLVWPSKADNTDNPETNPNEEKK